MVPKPTSLCGFVCLLRARLARLLTARTFLKRECPKIALLAARGGGHFILRAQNENETELVPYSKAKVKVRQRRL